MIRKITATTVAMLAIAGSGVASAATPEAIGEVTVTAQRSVGIGAEARAVGVCGDQVVAKLLPGHATQIRVVVPYSGSHRAIEDASIRHMPVEMTATHTKSGELLATANCTVSNKGELESMTIKLKDGTVIAELKPGDIRLEGGVSR